MTQTVTGPLGSRAWFVLEGRIKAKAEKFWDSVHESDFGHKTKNNWLVHLLHLKKEKKKKGPPFINRLPRPDLPLPPSLSLARPPARLLFAIKGEKRFTSASPPCLSGSWVPNETRRCLTASSRAGRQAGCQRSMPLAKVDKKKGGFNVTDYKWSANGSA